MQDRSLWWQRVLVGFYVLLAFVTPISAGAAFTGTVVTVTDGDTISVMRAATPVKVRLAGIDAPEKTQPGGLQARVFTANLVLLHTVTVTGATTDRYGRLIGTVHFLCDGRNLSYELVRAGMAWWYRAYAPKDMTLTQLEAEARAEGRGLWAQPNPIAPWAWRKGIR